MKKGDDLLKEILQRCASYKEEKNIPNIHARFFKDRQNAFEIVKKELSVVFNAWGRGEISAETIWEGLCEYFDHPRGFGIKIEFVLDLVTIEFLNEIFDNTDMDRISYRDIARNSKDMEVLELVIEKTDGNDYILGCMSENSYLTDETIMLEIAKSNCNYYYRKELANHRNVTVDVLKHLCNDDSSRVKSAAAQNLVKRI